MLFPRLVVVVFFVQLRNFLERYLMIDDSVPLSDSHISSVGFLRIFTFGDDFDWRAFDVVVEQYK